MQKYEPIERIRKLADEYVSEKFGSRVLGLHVRRGDHQRGELHRERLTAREAKLIQNITKIIKEHEDTRFYLSTDSKDVLSKFESTFPGKILSYPKNFAVSEPGQHKDAQEVAWLEMQILSRTRRVIGTMGSTFGQLSAELGGKPYRFIR